MKRSVKWTLYYHLWETLYQELVLLLTHDVFIEVLSADKMLLKCVNRGVHLILVLAYTISIRSGFRNELSWNDILCTITSGNYAYPNLIAYISYTLRAMIHPQAIPGGRFKNTYELLNQRALKFSYVNKIHIFQCMGKIFCVEFQRYPLKFHTKYLTHTLKDMIFMQFWNFKSS